MDWDTHPKALIWFSHHHYWHQNWKQLSIAIATHLLPCVSPKLALSTNHQIIQVCLRIPCLLPPLRFPVLGHPASHQTSQCSNQKAQAKSKYQEGVQQQVVHTCECTNTLVAAFGYKEAFYSWIICLQLLVRPHNAVQWPSKYPQGEISLHHLIPGAIIESRWLMTQEYYNDVAV